MRVCGIDPGTGSFDFFAMDGEEIILDTAVPVPDIAENPTVLLDTVKGIFPLDSGSFGVRFAANPHQGYESERTGPDGSR